LPRHNQRGPCLLGGFASPDQMCAHQRNHPRQDAGSPPECCESGTHSRSRQTESPLPSPRSTVIIGGPGAPPKTPRSGGGIFFFFWDFFLFFSPFRGAALAPMVSSPLTGVDHVVPSRSKHVRHHQKPVTYHRRTVRLLDLENSVMPRAVGQCSLLFVVSEGHCQIRHPQRCLVESRRLWFRRFRTPMINVYPMPSVQREGVHRAGPPYQRYRRPRPLSMCRRRRAKIVSLNYRRASILVTCACVTPAAMAFALPDHQPNCYLFTMICSISSEFERFQQSFHQHYTRSTVPFWPLPCCRVSDHASGKLNKARAQSGQRCHRRCFWWVRIEAACPPSTSHHSCRPRWIYPCLRHADLVFALAAVSWSFPHRDQRIVVIAAKQRVVALRHRR